MTRRDGRWEGPARRRGLPAVTMDGARGPADHRHNKGRPDKEKRALSDGRPAEQSEAGRPRGTDGRDVCDEWALSSGTDVRHPYPHQRVSRSR